ncbi:hypothetical protein A1F95_04482, partial [Pyrenophora tritici-repentis]
LVDEGDWEEGGEHEGSGVEIVEEMWVTKKIYTAMLAAEEQMEMDIQVATLTVGEGEEERSDMKKLAEGVDEM